MNKILLLDDGGTQVLPFAKSLHQKGYTVIATTTGTNTYSFGSRYIKKKYIFTSMHDQLAFKDFIIKILEREGCKSVIPMDDNSAEILSKYYSEFIKYTSYVMPEYSIFKKGYDKHSLIEVCQKGKYPHPFTKIVNGDNLNGIDINSLSYPILIKPNITCGARGMTLCTNSKELKEKFYKIQKEFGDCHIQQYIPEGGHQVEVQLYVSEKGELVQSSVIKKFRWYPEKGGSSCCNISYENKEIVNICYHILLDIGWVGFADFDTIEDPRTGELLIMEINPRVPACVKSAFASGIDWADVIVGEYLKKQHGTYKMEKEVYLRHLGFEVLWFMNSKNRWKTNPNWFKLLGSDIYYQDMSDWSDWMPFIRGSWGNVKKQMDPEFTKLKKGTEI